MSSVGRRWWWDGRWAAVVVIVSACAQAPPSLGDPDLDAGHEVFSDICAACHGGNGQGGSAPALTEVLSTFPDCPTHMQWVDLGSERWKDEVGSTYGATDKEITAVMPNFGTQLTPAQIRQVVAYERVQFGGADPESTLTDCVSP